MRHLLPAALIALFALGAVVAHADSPPPVVPDGICSMGGC